MLATNNAANPIVADAHRRHSLHLAHTRRQWRAVMSSPLLIDSDALMLHGSATSSSSTEKAASDSSLVSNPSRTSLCCAFLALVGRRWHRRTSTRRRGLQQEEVEWDRFDAEFKERQGYNIHEEEDFDDVDDEHRGTLRSGGVINFDAPELYAAEDVEDEDEPESRYVPADQSKWDRWRKYRENTERKFKEPAMRRDIAYSECIVSAKNLAACPRETHKKPEFALFGRSNVGKSSLINYMTGRSKLASTSKHPGHTKTISHMLIDKSWYLVDLPGIGHANGTASKLRRMNKLVTDYISYRKTIAGILYLVDGHLHPQKIDLQSIQWLTEQGKPLCIVFTKCDKEAMFHHRMHPEGVIAGLSEKLMEMSPWKDGKNLPKMFETSSKMRTGLNQVLAHIWEARRKFALKPNPVAIARMNRVTRRQVLYGETQQEPPPSVR